MPLSMWFWLCCFCILVFGAWYGYVTPPPGRWPVLGMSLVWLLALVILGMATFGGPVKG